MTVGSVLSVFMGFCAGTLVGAGVWLYGGV